MARTDDVTDAELVARCRRGDEQAWAALVERFSRYVSAIATQAYRLSDTDAEDVFQEVFARTYQHLERLRDDAAIRPWIGQLTRRLCIDRLRAAKREDVAGEELPDVEDPVAEQTITEIHEALDVREALGGLPEHCAEMLDRFFARDQSYRTIAEELEIPSGTIASRISRCLAKLREVIEGRSDPVGASSGGEDHG